MPKPNIVLSTELEGVQLFSRGKVRDLYDLGEQLLIVATDRISAFDYVIPNGIPYKGQVLTGLSAFWFEYTQDVVPNHIISTDVAEYPEILAPHREILQGRSMFVKKAERIDIECVVRGHIAGSAWKEYRQSGTVCGQKLPTGLAESEQLPEFLFTPATKADSGHDENISVAQMESIVGAELTGKLRDASVAIYTKGREYAASKGILLADTKFEFGLLDGELIVIDEMLTPDSSRFWPMETYEPGCVQNSFDKQYVRDYLESLDWDKQPPVPELPEEVVQRTSERYLEAYQKLTGKPLVSAG